MKELLGICRVKADRETGTDRTVLLGANVDNGSNSCFINKLAQEFNSPTNLKWWDSDSPG